MNLTFWGAAQQVTGSMHLLTLRSGYTVLIDCGVSYENRLNFEEENKNFPFDPTSIDLVILTHAHIDHSGNLPNLVKQGYNGQILCTDATVELTKYLLFDSMNVQNIEINKKKNNKKNGPKKVKQNRGSKASLNQALYSSIHVEKTVEKMIGIQFRKSFKVNNELEIEFYEAGHILGAASVRLSVTEGQKNIVVGFTGDLGNYNSKLVKDPQPMPELDYLITESTYGGRLHTDVGVAEEVMLKYIQDTCVKYNGKLVIPAFSVGRTQAILFTLHQLHIQGLLPDIKIFTDSPLAIRTTKLYDKYLSSLNEEANDFYRQNGHLFSFPQLQVIENPKESQAISMYPEPAIIVSAAGMVEGGRIQEHVKNHIGDTFSTVLIAGFCAEGTLGYELLRGKPTVRINKREKQVFAKIARTDAFSAHPDQNGLIHYLQQSNFKKLKKLFLVHGDKQSMELFKEKLNNDKAIIPSKGQSFLLD